jgi:hypothetical protein
MLDFPGESSSTQIILLKFLNSSNREKNKDAS